MLFLAQARTLFATRRFWALALAVALVGGLVGYRWLREARVSAHWHAAQDALAREDFAVAEPHLEACLQAWPGRADVQLLAARIAMLKGNADLAEQHLQTAESLPGPAEAVTLEWNLLQASRARLSPEIEQYLWSLLSSRHPETPAILEALTEGYRWTYQLPRAMECANAWLAKQPESGRALLARGWLWKRANQPEKARDDYRQALKYHPDLAAAHLRLAELLIEKRVGDPKEAVEHFEWLRQHQGDSPEVLLGLARSRRALGENDAPRALLQDLLQGYGDDAPALLELAKIESDAGEWPQATEHLERAYALAPHNRDVCYALAQSYERQDRKAPAATFHEKVKAIDRDLERLQTLIKQAGVDAPRDPAPRCEIGKLLLRNDREAEALRWFAMALERDPGHRPTHQALAEYYEKKGNPSMARTHYEKAGMVELHSGPRDKAANSTPAGPAK